jgi:hypothetical protein
MRKRFKYLGKSRKLRGFDPLSAELSAPLIYLFPLGTYTRSIIVVVLIGHKLLDKRGFAYIPLAVHDQYLTAFAVIIMIQILAFCTSTG